MTSYFASAPQRVHLRAGRRPGPRDYRGRRERQRRAAAAHLPGEGAPQKDQGSHTYIQGSAKRLKKVSQKFSSKIYFLKNMQ